MWLSFIPNSLTACALCMNSETHPATPWGTSQALTWSHLHHCVPVFHPSCGVCSSRHLRLELSLLKRLRHWGFPSPPASLPGNLLKEPSHSWRPLTGWEATTSQCKDHPSVYTPWLPFAVALYPKTNSQHRLAFSPLGRRGDRDENQLFICLEDIKSIRDKHSWYNWDFQREAGDAKSGARTELL